MQRPTLWIAHKSDAFYRNWRGANCQPSGKLLRTKLSTATSPGIVTGPTCAAAVITFSLYHCTSCQAFGGDMSQDKLIRQLKQNKIQKNISTPSCFQINPNTQLSIPSSGHGATQHIPVPRLGVVTPCQDRCHSDPQVTAHTEVRHWGDTHVQSIFININHMRSF